ncbi:MAG: response regulator [Verrucomicrobiota bacterium]|nr:response regulator [Verrucomicrobiota bacterium]
MNNKKILVVDDEVFMLKLLQFILGKTGCGIETAGSGEEAVQRVGIVSPDLMIIDVMMPGMTGFEAVQTIKSKPLFEHLPVIMLTARGQQATRQQAKEAGASVFLTKPFSPVELIHHVTELLQTKAA